jgi:hypothetical protein
VEIFPSKHRIGSFLYGTGGEDYCRGACQQIKEFAEWRVAGRRLALSSETRERLLACTVNGAVRGDLFHLRRIGLQASPIGLRRP